MSTGKSTSSMPFQAMEWLLAHPDDGEESSEDEDMDKG